MVVAAHEVVFALKQVCGELSSKKSCLLLLHAELVVDLSLQDGIKFRLKVTVLIHFHLVAVVKPALLS